MTTKQRARAGRWHWVLTAVLLLAVLLIGIRCFWYPFRVTTVYLVRHAERAEGGADPPLSAAGQARAQHLAHVLSDAGVDAVFVTEFVRTQQTGEPTASAIGAAAQQYQAGNAAGLVETIRSSYGGRQVLVVGHSNTVDDIAQELGISGISDLPEGRFDRLFVIHRIADSAYLERLRYGEPTP